MKTEWTDEERREVLFAFKEKYPNYRGLSLAKMKEVLDGNLVIVHNAGRRNKFVLMTKEDVVLGGKLDKINAEISAKNRITRQKNKEIKRENHAFAKAWLVDILGVDTFNKMFR